MNPLNTLGNLIWLVFGGLYSAIFYVMGGFALCLTIIGIPFGLQCFKLASFVLWLSSLSVTIRSKTSPATITRSGARSATASCGSHDAPWK